MPHTYPHIPLGASARFRGKSAEGLYGDVVEEVDWSVGEVLQTLKQNGLDRNTLVMFSSDNGPVVSGQPRKAARAQEHDLRGRHSRAVHRPLDREHPGGPRVATRSPP